MLDAPVIRTLHVDELRQVTLALAPTVSVQFEASQTGLELDPAMTSHVEPATQVALQEFEHVPEQLFPAEHCKLHDEPFALQLATDVQPQDAALPPVAQVHADPLHAHCAAGQVAGGLLAQPVAPSMHEPKIQKTPATRKDVVMDRRFHRGPGTVNLCGRRLSQAVRKRAHGRAHLREIRFSPGSASVIFAALHARRRSARRGRCNC